MIDDLRQLAIFSKTVEHGSFRGAAAELGLSPSVVSHHISQLEDKLGVALLYRSTRRLSLTQDGERMFDSVRQMLDTVERGLNDIQQRSLDPSGNIRITVPSVLSHSNLFAGLAGFAKAYPKVTLDIDLTDDRKNLIRDGYDLAIRMGPHRKRGPSRKVLFKAHRQIVTSHTYHAKIAEVENPKDLLNFDWIELTPARGLKSILRKSGARDVVLSPKAQISVNSAQAVMQLVRAGAGIGFLPDFLFQQAVQSGELVVVFPNWTLDPLEIYAEWPQNTPSRGLPRLLVKYLASLEFTT